MFFIIKVIKRRKLKGKKSEVFVSWVGWPEKFNSWIPATSIRDHARGKK